MQFQLNVSAATVLQIDAFCGCLKQPISPFLKQSTSPGSVLELMVIEAL